MTRHPKPTLTLFEAVLIVLVAVIWISLFAGAVSKEEKARRVYMLDNTGAPVGVYVWEAGKGYRLPTQEEEEYDLDRKEGMQR